MYPQGGNPVHEHRWLQVDTLAGNPRVLDDYPHRYVFLAHGNGGGELTSAYSRMVAARLFWAVETMEAAGWEPVAWDLDGQVVGVVMRRVAVGDSYTVDPPSGPWT